MIYNPLLNVLTLAMQIAVSVDLENRMYRTVFA